MNNERSAECAEKSPRLPQLDAMRGLAALWVVIFHWTVRYDQLYGHGESLLFRVPDGRHGVHLFFMISGFVILMTLDKISSVRDFIVFRFTRLYPTQWVCAAITFTAVAVFGLPGREVKITDAIMNATMIAYTLRFKFIDSVYWSLEVEIFFYGLMAALFALGLRRFLIPILAGLMALNVIFLLLPGTVVELPGAIKLLRLLLSLRYLHLFLFGILCYEINRRPRRWYYPLLVLCLLVPTTDRVQWSLSAPADSDFIAIDDFIFVMVMGLLFWFGTQREVFFLRSRILIFLGFISYPLYLLHQNLGFVIMRQSYAFGIPSSLVLCAPLLVVFPLATIISYQIEHPVNLSLRRWYRKRMS